jgi:hypothetical protein
MILVEGMDLAGKSTLVRGLEDAVRQLRGISGVRVANNTLVEHNPVDHVAQRWASEPDAGFKETGAIFLASHLLDALNFTPPAAGEVHLQDSSWFRTLSFHGSMNTPDIPALLRSSCASAQPVFDAVIYITADIPARVQRLHSRAVESPGQNDHNDEQVETNPDRFMAMDERLWGAVRERYPEALKLDSSGLDKGQVLALAMAEVSRVMTARCFESAVTG